MDALPDWAAHLLNDHQETLTTYGPYARQAYMLISTARSYTFALIDQVSRKPDLATIALLLIILFVSLKILGILFNTLLFWLRLARRIVFWGGLVGLGLWLYTRGPDGVLEDMQYWWQVWNQEHTYWREKEKVARFMKEQRGGLRQGERFWF